MEPDTHGNKQRKGKTRRVKMKRKLIKQGKARVAKSELTPEQMAFAEWLAIPSFERVPPTQKELAAQLNVSERTLKNWKKIPEIWLVVGDTNENELRELVPEARAVIEKAIRNPGSISRVTFDAAKHILAQWGEQRERAGGDIVRTIVEMYKKYNPDV